MNYVVKKGDSLSKIASQILGGAGQWKELAKLNGISAPYKIYVGQVLNLPMQKKQAAAQQTAKPLDHMAPKEEANFVYARAFFFVLADEILPSGKVVRKVLQFPTNQLEHVLAHPEIYGMKAPNPFAPISIGEHALGSNISPYLSASTLQKGAPNIAGRPVYIDVAKAQKAGVVIHSTADIAADLDRLVASNPSLKPRVELLKKAISQVEYEVLLQGDVPSSAIKSASSMRITQGLRVVQFIGFAVTAYDVGVAVDKSVKNQSSKPVMAEVVRQVGGWGGAWMGAKIGGVAGAAVGIETGPGAILTGAVGAVIFGAAGYFGADWIADYIDEN